jgi:uncharacterized membrane protein
MIGGFELHPSVVHFPIALTVVGALFTVLYAAFRREWLRWFAPVLLSLALLGAVAAYFSGQSAEDRAEAIGVPETAIEEHESAGIWSLGLISLTCLLSWATFVPRRGVWITVVIAVVAVATVLRTGHLGGTLVYVHGAGRVQGSPAGGMEEKE